MWSLEALVFNTKKGLQVFQDTCRLSSEAAKVTEERRWLSQTTVPDAGMIEEVLHNARPCDEVLRHRDFIPDVSDFSTLACERYVNGFTIDVVSFKLLERRKPTGVIYLSSFSQTWAKQGVEYFRHKVNSFFSHCQVADTGCILTPLHFESPQHWGLLCWCMHQNCLLWWWLEDSPSKWYPAHCSKHDLCFQGYVRWGHSRATLEQIQLESSFATNQYAHAA